MFQIRICIVAQEISTFIFIYVSKIRNLTSSVCKRELSCVNFGTYCILHVLNRTNIVVDFRIKFEKLLRRIYIKWYQQSSGRSGTIITIASDHVGPSVLIEMTLLTTFRAFIALTTVFVQLVYISFQIHFADSLFFSAAELKII